MQIFAHKVCFTNDYMSLLEQFHSYIVKQTTRVYPKVPGQCLSKEVCLPWMLNSSITFKVLPFCTNTAVPAFLPCLEASMEVPFWNCVKYPLRFLLNLFSGVESLTLHPKLQLGEEDKVVGARSGNYGEWDHCHVVLGQKLETLEDL